MRIAVGTLHATSLHDERGFPRARRSRNADQNGLKWGQAVLRTFSKGKIGIGSHVVRERREVFTCHFLSEAGLVGNV